MKKQTDEEIIKHILDCKTEARDATIYIRRRNKELWELYQNRQDYSGKEAWQARCFVPKVFMTIEQSSAMVKRAVISINKLFKAIPKHPDDQLAKKAQRDVEIALKNRLLDSNFTECYGEMIKGSFLLGLGVPKVLWDKGFVFYNCDIADLNIHPLYQPHDKEPPKYIQEEGAIDLAALREKAKRINAETRAVGKRPVYRMAEINKIEEDFTDPERDVELRRRRGLGDYNALDKKVRTIQHWGSIVSEDGKTAKRNQLVEVANGVHIIRHQDNPFDHAKPPYIPTVPLVYPHRGVAGIGLANSIVPLQYITNNVINMAVDNLNFSVNKMYQYQPTNLVNPRSMTKVFPGKTIASHTSNDAIKEVRTSQVSNDVWEVLRYLNSEMEKGTAVTEFISGQSSSTRKTLGEVELKTAQAQGLFDVVARDIEANSLSPLIEMCFELMIQFGEIPEQLRSRYNFQVGGLSLLLAQREQRANVNEALEVALKQPNIAQMTDLAELYKKFLELRGLGEVYSEKKQPLPNEAAMAESERGKQSAQTDFDNMTPQEKEDALSQMQ